MMRTLICFLGLLVSVPAVAVETEATSCFPACRTGYLCHEGRCISKCNPVCPRGERCTDAGECEAADDVDASARSEIAGPPRDESAPVADRLEIQAQIALMKTGATSRIWAGGAVALAGVIAIPVAGYEASTNYFHMPTDETNLIIALSSLAILTGAITLGVGADMLNKASELEAIYDPDDASSLPFDMTPTFYASATGGGFGVSGRF